MPSKSLKVSFVLDPEDTAYFRRLFRKARQASADRSQDEVISAAHELVGGMRSAKKIPNFVREAMETIDDLTQIIEDEDYRAPRTVRDKVVAALAYFAQADDLIPDEVPVLGFLDDAIMIKFVEEEFKHELRGYRKFRRFRDGAEQRPWTEVASSRLPSRLEAQRKKIRAEIDRKRKRDADKGVLHL